VASPIPHGSAQMRSAKLSHHSFVQSSDDGIRLCRAANPPISINDCVPILTTLQQSSASQHCDPSFAPIRAGPTCTNTGAGSEQPSGARLKPQPIDRLRHGRRVWLTPRPSHGSARISASLISRQQWPAISPLLPKPEPEGRAQGSPLAPLQLVAARRNHRLAL
jgi:hypothetical protein